MFADDAIVEDPIGPSAFDPEGKGHRGRDAISAFWDLAIANTTKIEFIFRDTYQCGNEEANVGHILITTGDYQVTAEGVFTYKANDEGKLVALRAYWEMERAAASTRRVQIRDRDAWPALGRRQSQCADALPALPSLKLALWPL